MAILKFQLKSQHLLLLKHLKWSLIDNYITSVEKNNNYDSDLEGQLSPFGGLDLYEDIGIILYGKPMDFNPLDSEESYQYSEEQKTEMKQLFSELPTALNLILSRQSFELGKFKTKDTFMDWKQIS